MCLRRPNVIKQVIEVLRSSRIDVAYEQGFPVSTDVVAADGERHVVTAASKGIRRRLRAGTTFAVQLGMGQKSAN